MAPGAIPRQLPKPRVGRSPMSEPVVNTLVALLGRSGVGSFAFGITRCAH